MTTILGISCHYHDGAAALLRDGRLVAASEEERFSRQKHDFRFPTNAIEFVLREGQITADDLDYIVFYEKPLAKFERVLTTSLHTSPFSWRVFQESLVSWLTEKLWVRGLIRDKLRFHDKSRILFSEHHISHAASAYYCSPFDQSAVLTADGVGEWTTATLGLGNGNSLKILDEMRFPHSVGLLYSTFTAFLGFEVNEGEYKVMGMGAYGQPKYTTEIEKIIKIGNDGSVHLNLEYFSFQHSVNRMFSSRFESLFGHPRDPKQADEIDQHYADIAASIQLVTEEIMVKMARHLHQKTQTSNLCMAGGVALNSLANYRIMREAGFDALYIQPASGDAGGALGAALWAHHDVLGNPRSFAMDHAYWGERFSDSDAGQFLNESGIAHWEAKNEDQLTAYTADAIKEGKVVGWHQGRAEWGPRALGNRSILADPRRAEMKGIINEKIKFREPFRPFAPSILAEKASEMVELSDPENQSPSKFMLYVTPVKDDKRDVIPAVTHEDGTTRLQTVHEDSNPLYYKLISEFDSGTGVPALINTSFNLRGEPIVNSPESAYDTFSRSGIDLLVIGPFVCQKD